MLVQDATRCCLLPRLCWLNNIVSQAEEDRLGMRIPYYFIRQWQSRQEACAAKLAPSDTQIVDLLAREHGNHCVLYTSQLRSPRHALPTSHDIVFRRQKGG